MLELDELLRGELESRSRRRIKLEIKLNALPKGTIVTKKIKGRQYDYLQYRENKKVVTQYLKPKEKEKLYLQIQCRKNLTIEVDALKKEINRLVQMLKDYNNRREFYV